MTTTYKNTITRLLTLGFIATALLLGTWFSFAPQQAHAQSGYTGANRSSGSSSSQIQSTIDSLMKQIEALQKQLDELRNGSSNSGGGSSVGGGKWCPRLNRALGRGSQGEDVSDLQRYLAEDEDIYPEGEITGYYGPATERAVQRWQGRRGVASGGTAATTGYGHVGPKTRDAIARHCGGSSGGGNTSATVDLSVVDLEVEHEDWDVDADRTNEVTFGIKNASNRAMTVEYTLSFESEDDSMDEPRALTSRTFVRANETATVKRNVTFPNFEDGDYDFKVVIDPDDEVDEKSESNNEDSVTVTVGEAGTGNDDDDTEEDDIILDDVSVKTSGSGSSATRSATFKVENTFDEDQEVTYTISVMAATGSTVHQTIDGTVDVDAGETVTVTKALANRSAGNYRLKVELDPDEDIDEEDEDNNDDIVSFRFGSGTPTGGDQDDDDISLEDAKVAVSEWNTTSRTNSVSFTIVNTFTDEQDVAYKIRIMGATGSTVYQTIEGSEEVMDGDSVDVTKSISKTGLAAGDYRAVIELDQDDDIDEEDEDNNDATVNFKVTTGTTSTDAPTVTLKVDGKTSNVDVEEDDSVQVTWSATSGSSCKLTVRRQPKSGGGNYETVSNVSVTGTSTVAAKVSGVQGALTAVAMTCTKSGKSTTKTVDVDVEGDEDEDETVYGNISVTKQQVSYATIATINGPSELMSRINACKYTAVGWSGYSGNGLEIDWGDGTGTFPKAPGASQVGLSCANAVKSHIYVTPKTYTITAKLWHPGPADAPVYEWIGTTTVSVQ